MNFRLLPEEMKIEIFSYFTTKQISQCLAPVCKEWWTLCKTPSLWTRLELNTCCGKPADVYRQVLARCQTSLTSLTLCTKFKVSVSIPTIFSDFKPRKLKELDLDRWWLCCDEDVFTTVSNCRDLEILSLMVNAEDSSSIRYISTLKNLKKLNIFFDYECLLPNPNLEPIVKECAKLEALIVEMEYWSDDELLYQLAKYRKDTLSHLVLDVGQFIPDGIGAKTSCLNLSTLRLNLNYCPPMGDMLCILSGTKKVEWLEFGGPNDIEPQAWDYFCKSPHLSSLRILEIDGSFIDDSGVASLATTCKQLVILNLTSRNLHDDGVRAVIDNCSGLFFLGVSESKLTSNIFTDIPNKLPKLQYLNLRICKGIDERAVVEFQRICPRVKVMYNFEIFKVDYTVDERLRFKWQFGL